MITWSRADLENWADEIIKDFLGADYTKFAPIDIHKLATEYLGLTVKYEKLSDNLDVYGVSAFRDTVIDLHRNGTIEKYPIKADTILLEESLQSPELYSTQRFTSGHETAHQILRRWENRHAIALLCKEPDVAFSLKHPNTPPPERNWREWQADTLGASLLMPRRLVDECIFRFGVSDTITVYGQYSMLKADRMHISNLSGFLGVSKQALIRRLLILGYAERKPQQEYYEKRMVDLLWENKQESRLLRPRRTYRL